MRRTVVARLVTTFVLAIPLAGCRRETTDPAPAAALINEPFFITGTITDASHPWGYRVQGEPGTSYRATDVVFSVGDSTVIQHADGSAATAAELTVGRAMSLWITGAIAESFPPQVGARLIVLR
jgi:hypothetical protein